MARKIKAKVSYNKNKKAPKAALGSLLQIGMGVDQIIKSRKAERAFDKDSLNLDISKTTRKLAESPIDENIIKQQQENALTLHSQTMGNVVKGDQRNIHSVATQAQDTAQKGLLEQKIEENAARTEAMRNLAMAEGDVEANRIGVAKSEIAGIKAEKDAGYKNVFSGVENIESQATSALGMGKHGAKIEAEEGGVTPGEFSHEGNPIDMVQNGEKIGEATGGELILPPDDVEAVRAALDEGDKDAAFKLMEDLVAKYDENVIEAKDSEAQDGGKVKGKKTTTSLHNPEESKNYQDKRLERIRKAEFNEEFAAARKAGKKTFTFRGDEYTTKLKEETPKMNKGGYLERVKARMGAYMKSKY